MLGKTNPFHGHRIYHPQHRVICRLVGLRHFSVRQYPEYLFAFFYLLAFLGAGLLISTYSNTQQQAMFLAFFFLIIFFLLSGLFTPVSSMPQWAQVITRINPLRYFVEVMRLVYLKGSGLRDILPQLCTMIGLAVTLNSLAILSYRKRS